jgi:hypothetical protein
MYPRFQEFLEVREKYDPHHIFEPATYAHMVAKHAIPAYPGCTYSGDCYCQDDSHCTKGYKCVASKAFPQYKGCKIEKATLAVFKG